MSFATLDDFYTVIGDDGDGSSDAQVQLLLDLATAVITAWTRQDIALVTDDVVELPGTWNANLELPQFPVVDISAVSVNGIALGDAEWTWNQRQTLRRGGGARAFDYPAGALVAAAAGDVVDWPLQQSGAWHWNGPDATVTVTYSHGYDPVPADVQAVCLALATRIFTNPTGAVSEQVLNYQVTYDQAARARAAGMALTPEDQQALRKYRRWWG
jgi:hypothetical protein